MNIEAVRTFCKLRKVNQSDLAKMAGVSRQAVSNWFKNAEHGEVNVRSSALRGIAQGLRVSVEDLLHPLPVLDDPALVREYETLFLWDRLYPGIGDFSVALVRGEAAALARLVQALGLYAAAKVAGRKIWDRFPQYKMLIRPVRREQLEVVWQYHENPGHVENQPAPAIGELIKKLVRSEGNS